MKRVVVVGLVACVLSGAEAGCLSRLVDSTPPKLNQNFTSVVQDQAIDKVDILFDIDNSASMGDKQDYLKAAIPDLVHRLVNPNCIDANKMLYGPSTMGDCSHYGSAAKPEFQAVHDMHLGIISSSLGPRGGDACLASAMAPDLYANVSAHNDDGAHLLTRSLSFSPPPPATPTAVSPGVVPDAPPADPFLYWFPAADNPGKAPGPGTPLSSSDALIQEFKDLVGGTGAFGCGIESQLESWYRFLVQPDPYSSIVASGGTAAWSGVDTEILHERHDFLRPDSLVAIIVLSDENDSEIDVRSLGGQAYKWMSSDFPPPKGTTGCGTGLPGSNVSSSCQSCAEGNNRNTDPNCAGLKGDVARYTAPNDWGNDMNLRHVHMKAKYGVDLQYPIDRYVAGLTSSTVPDRRGEYPPGAGAYVGTRDCQNPLFAAALPDGTSTDPAVLCHAPPGTQRTKGLVFYAHIGGVPYQLLHFDPANAEKSVLTSDDWVKILGKDPEGLDYTGIDPHMIESYEPRPNLAPPGSAAGTDPISGHEWVTRTGAGHIMHVDRQYACIFPLEDDKGRPAPRDCTLSANRSYCDCPLTAGSVSAEELPPICDAATQTTQTAAKAYPTIRELLLAKKLGAQGIVSSICPQHVAEETPGDPLYGYRPAVSVIVDRLKDALTGQCLPQKLQVTDGSVPCLILLRMPQENGGSCLAPHCDAAQGLSVPDSSEVLPQLCRSLEEQYQAGGAQGGVDPANLSVCELRQLTPTANPSDFMGNTCANAPDKGWCYVTDTGSGSKCPQSIVFSPKAIPPGATSLLQCLEESPGVTAQ